MFDSDYHSWLRKKYKIENFYKVPKYLKKCCYDVEQELIDTEEVNLVKVSIVEYLGDYYLDTTIKTHYKFNYIVFILFFIVMILLLIIINFIIRNKLEKV